MDGHSLRLSIKSSPGFSAFTLLSTGINLYLSIGIVGYVYFIGKEGVGIVDGHKIIVKFAL